MTTTVFKLAMASFWRNQRCPKAFKMHNRCSGTKTCTSEAAATTSQNHYILLQDYTIHVLLETNSSLCANMLPGDKTTKLP